MPSVAGRGSQEDGVPTGEYVRGSFNALCSGQGVAREITATNKTIDH